MYVEGFELMLLLQVVYSLNNYLSICAYTDDKVGNCLVG